MRLNTVSGPIDADALGRTLMHEHLLIGFPGWQSDVRASHRSLEELARRCTDKIAEIAELGFRSLVDPCPADIGRDVRLMADVASRTGFNIVCATGWYHEKYGANAYWRARAEFDPDCTKRMTEVMVTEIREGIDGTSIKAGVIKLATSQPPITAFERMAFAAGAAASIETGVPIMTHSDAILGPEQVALLSEFGIPADRIIVGHCCGTDDRAYHRQVAETGAYIGFDRFGAEYFNSDEQRIQSLLALLRDGYLKRLVISHDCNFCLLGEQFPSKLNEMVESASPAHFSTRIVPRLAEAGISTDQIDELLVDNPRRFFFGPKDEKDAHASPRG